MFDETLEKVVISLNSKFAGYFNGGHWEEVAHVFIVIALTRILKCMPIDTRVLKGEIEFDWLTNYAAKILSIGRTS